VDTESESSKTAPGLEGKSQGPSLRTTVLSNKRPMVPLLETLLSEDTEKVDKKYKTRVDVTLRVPGVSPPYILLLFLPEIGKPSITMNIVIGLNGHISVTDSSGIWENITTTPTEKQVQDLHSKLARVLETAEDLGILIEWTQNWMREQRKERRLLG
jgi:hypothetical protein